jgi:hypothetical protein
MNLKDNALEIILEEGDTNTITWTGKSESRDPSAVLNPYFAEILNRLKGKELVVRFETLKYMNSSSVPPIIKLIKSLQEAGITAKITYDKNSRWQAASFKALETIVLSMPYITVQGV